MLQQELDLFVLMPRFAAFLRIVELNAPAPLAKAAAAQHASGGESHFEILTKFWPHSESEFNSESASNLDPSQTLMAWMFLQPYAEYLADYTARPPLHATPPICPQCSSKPLAGAPRPAGDGGEQSRLCLLGATEGGVC